MSFFQTNHRVKKMVGKVLIFSGIISFCFLGAPQKTLAIYGIADVVIDPTNLVQNTISSVADVKSILKDFVLDGIAWQIGNMMIQKLTAQTVNWINSGFEGNPAYVTDPDQFFLDIGDNVASKVLSGTALNKLCTPFRAQVRLTLVKNYLQETSGEYYSCTLGQIEQNYENFINDFEQGGWDSWFQITQNSQNNPYGAYYQAKNSLEVQVQSAISNKQKQLDWGGGFLSYEKCDKNAPGYIAERTVSGVKIPEKCTKKEIVTPGSVINDQLKKAIGSGADRLNVSNSINQIVGALMTQMITRVVGGGGGLRGDNLPAPSESERKRLEERLNQKIPALAPDIDAPLPSEQSAKNAAQQAVTEDSATTNTDTGTEPAP